MNPFVRTARFEGAGLMVPNELIPLRNPYRVPVLIDRLLFAYPHRHSTDDSVQLFSVDVKLGRAQLTGGLVPLRGIAPLDSTRRSAQTIVCYPWKMPRPVYLPSGASFQVQIVTNGTLSTWCDVSMVGRMLEADARPPAQVSLPWVNKFEVPSTQTEAVTSSTELTNPFQVPLHTTGILRVDEPSRWAVVGSVPTLTITDHNGKPVCRSSVGTTSLFSGRVNLWPVNCVLQPRQGFHLSFDEYADWNQFLMNSPFHLLGWRNSPSNEVF